nr:hypothetical protein [Shewanella sp. SR1]
MGDPYGGSLLCQPRRKRLPTMLRLSIEHYSVLGQLQQGATQYHASRLAQRIEHFIG